MSEFQHSHTSDEFEHSHTSDDFGHFFKGWIRNPLAIGALAPSSKSLAKLMAKDVGMGARVVELGAGTGTVTAALLASGVAPGNLHLVERELACWGSKLIGFHRVFCDNLRIRE